MDKAPDAYRTISEVAEDLDIAQHVLRFWETRFPQIKPLKRGGGRRYYRPDDVELLKGIRHLLYKEGYTIKGVQRILKEQGPRAVQALMQPDEVMADWAPPEVEPLPIAPQRPIVTHAPLHAPVRSAMPPQPPVMPARTQTFVPMPGVQRLSIEEEAPVFQAAPFEQPPDVEPKHDSEPKHDLPAPALAEEQPVPTPMPMRDDVIALLREREAGMARGQVSNGQVSMFRGGLHRSENGSIQAGQLAMQAEAPLMEEPSPSLQAIRRETLLGALRELEECRVMIEGLLAGRSE